MKLAVISDLHGNYYALAKVLAFLRSQEIDGIIGLGDFVTDGPFPQRMMRVLREMQEEFPCYLVRGNREEYLLENIRHPQNWKAGSSTSGLLDYTFRNLTGQDLEFFEHLPTDGVLVGKINESGRLIPVFVPQEEITPDTCRESLFPALRLCHGAPENSVGISVCIRSFCCPIWKISMPQSCSAGTATSRSKENMPKKHT